LINKIREAFYCWKKEEKYIYFFTFFEEAKMKYINQTKQVLPSTRSAKTRLRESLQCYRTKRKNVREKQAGETAPKHKNGLSHQ